MIEYRLAVAGDIEKLKKLWELSFGDPKVFINFYFVNRFEPENTLLLLKKQEIASMLTKIPVKLVTPTGNYEGAMFYAIATHPEYRKQGLATQLTEFANDGLIKEGKEFSVIVPASQELFKFYLKQGYEESFLIRQTKLDFQEIAKYDDEPVNHCKITPITPSYYNQKRRELLKGKNYIDYAENEIIYQQKIARFSGADLYLVEILTEEGKQTQGIMAVERIDGSRIIIKECLLPEMYLPLVIKKLALLLPAKEYIIRTPVFTGETLGGNLLPFAVFKNLGAKSVVIENKAYLGIAFD